MKDVFNKILQIIRGLTIHIFLGLWCRVSHNTSEGVPDTSTPSEKDVGERSDL